MCDVISRVEAAYRAHVGGLRTELLDPPEVKALHRSGNEIRNESSTLPFKIGIDVGCSHENFLCIDGVAFRFEQCSSTTLKGESS